MSANKLPPGLHYAGESLWHYTVGSKLGSIAASGGLIPLPTNGAPITERPVIWLSQEAIWEPTSAKAIQDIENGSIRILTMQETHEYCDGLFRFKISPAFHVFNIHGFKAQSRIKQRTFDALLKRGISQGAKPYLWYVSFDPILAKDIECVEGWNGETWVNDLPELFQLVALATKNK